MLQFLTMDLFKLIVIGIITDITNVVIRGEQI